VVECLVLSQARDGSTTLRNLIEGFLFFNGENFSNFGYVTDTYDLWPALRENIVRNDGRALYGILRNWQHTYEISHGLSFALPAVCAVLGPSTRIVRVVRDQKSHVRSLMNQSQIDPEHWIGYRDFDAGAYPGKGIVARPTAIDYGEADERTWRAMSLVERFEWFTQKQTDLADAHLNLFSDVMTISTEELSDEARIKELGNFINPSWPLVPGPTHVHRLAGLDMDAFGNETRRYIENAWQNFDFAKAVTDPEYALKYVISDLQSRYRDDPAKLSELISKILADCQVSLNGQDS